MLVQLELSLTERQELDECESIIAQGLQTFVNVGSALLTIRDKRLYRAEYGTFEGYCRERWNFTRMRASQLISAAEVVQNVNTCLQTLPANEAQARPLTRLEPEKQREVWADVVQEAEESGEKITGAKVQQAVNRLAPLMTSDSEEWYTPPGIQRRARAALGGIDLDPCSNSHVSPNIQAARHYTIEDDGLTQPWQGTVYMNPPYGRAIEQWVDKLLAEYQAGRTVKAIALVPARTDTAWFQRFRDFPICFIRGRLRFSEAENSATFPSAVVGLGMEAGHLAQHFSDIGDIYVRYERGNS